MLSSTNLFSTKLTDCRRERGKVSDAHVNNKKEIAMSATVTVGKRLIPIEHIALIEPFDAAAQAKLQTDVRFKRVSFSSTAKAC